MTKTNPFAQFLQLIENLPKNTPASIVIETPEGDSWTGTLGDVYDALMTAFFETPASRKELDRTETLTFESPTWEYTSCYFDTSTDFVSEFNRRGAVGWELVHCFLLDDRGDDSSLLAIFKRQK